MTSKQIYEATAIELSNIQAPALKLYEFNYYFNQAIRQFVNKIYNIYDVNQQTTDDLRVLKSTATLVPTMLKPSGNPAIDYLHGATYFVDMPDDYLHLLNCICFYTVNKKKDCWNEGDVMVVGATKLTADSWSSVVDDVYNRPTKKHPYYYIHNQNKIYVDSNKLTSANGTLPSNPDTDSLKGFKRTFDYYESQSGNLLPEAVEMDAVEQTAGSRYANSSKVRVEIRCGRDTSNVFELAAVQIDYVKAPQFVRLTQEQLDSDEDISQVMEFPDYVSQEIINELVNLVMRKTNDPSLQAHMQITQSIARPTGQQAQQ